jgi:ABC-type transport system substrate-binding protein
MRLALAAALAATLVLPAAARAETVLRVGMTAADIPATTGAPDQGAEGWRTAGTTMYDSLVQWDLSSADKPSTLKPDLATDWAIDPANPRRWVLHLRQGVRFHDGSAWNADAAIWNLDSMLKKDSPQYDPRRYAQSLGKLNTIASYAKLDEYTIELVTKAPDALVPYNLTIFWQASPTQFDKLGHDWNAYARAPVGTGPWKFDRMVPRERLELVANPDYWDATRRAHTDRLTFQPIPDPSTRVASLLSGQVDWIEAPSPDAIPQLKAQGFVIVTNVYPHIWPWFLSQLPGSPFADVRVRQAMNFAIDRDAIVQFLGGTALPAVGEVPPDSPWFGKPAMHYRYDPAEAKRLLAEAGYGPGRPVRARIVISPSGSGQMQPLPMNEALQQQLAAVGIEISFEVMDWNTVRTRRAQGAQSPENKGFDGMNYSWTTGDPDFGFLTTMLSSRIPPVGANWGNIRDPQLDAMGAQIAATFDAPARDALIAQFHARVVDQAEWLFVVHDLNARAMSPHVTGFVSARNWTQDFTPVVMK